MQGRGEEHPTGSRGIERRETLGLRKTDGEKIGRPRRVQALPASAAVTRGIKWGFEAPEPARNGERTKICPDDFEITKVDHFGLTDKPWELEGDVSSHHLTETVQ